MILLTDLERDALAESFNVSLGAAAAVFSDIVREEIQLSVPMVEVVPRERLINLLAELTDGCGQCQLCCISQHYRSNLNFDTETLLLFPGQGSLEIVRLMLGDNAAQVSQITELEQDALCEIGNIIINSCMSAMADMFGAEVIGTLPGVRTIDPSRILDDHPENDVILVARIGMTMLHNNISGYVLFIMSVPSLEAFMTRVRLFFHLSAE